MHLINSFDGRHDSPVVSSKAAGAPEEVEIEVTSEMIEVGAEVIERLEGFLPTYVAAEVYRAMESLCSDGRTSQPPLSRDALE